MKIFQGRFEIDTDDLTDSDDVKAAIQEALDRMRPIRSRVHVHAYEDGRIGGFGPLVRLQGEEE